MLSELVTPEIIRTLLIIVGIVFVIFCIYLGVFTVGQQTFKVVERFGKFSKICNSGLNFMIPFIDRIAGSDSYRIQQLEVPVETKTKDNVFIIIKISVQFHIIKEKAYDAFYKLFSPEPQITS